MRNATPVPPRGFKPQALKMKQRNKVKKRSWGAAIIAGLIAVSWAVGGLILPSLAAVGQKAGVWTETITGQDVDGIIKPRETIGQFGTSFDASSALGLMEASAAEHNGIAYVGGSRYVYANSVKIYSALGGLGLIPNPNFTTMGAWIPVPEGMCASGVQNTKPAGRSAIPEKDPKVTDGSVKPTSPSQTPSTETTTGVQTPKTSDPVPTVVEKSPSATVDTVVTESVTTQSKPMSALIPPAAPLDNTEQVSSQTPVTQTTETVETPKKTVEQLDITQTEISDDPILNDAEDDVVADRSRSGAATEEPIDEEELADRNAISGNSCLQEIFADQRYVSGGYGYGGYSTYQPAITQNGAALRFGQVNSSTINPQMGWFNPQVLGGLMPISASGSGTLWTFCIEPISNQGQGGSSTIDSGYHGMSPVDESKLKLYSMIATMAAWTKADWQKYIGPNVSPILWAHQSGGTVAQIKLWAKVYQIALWQNTVWGNATTDAATQALVNELIAAAQQAMADGLKSGKEAIEGLKLEATEAAGGGYNLTLAGYDKLASAKAEIKNLTVTVPSNISWTDSSGRTQTGGQIPIAEITGGKSVRLNVAGPCNGDTFGVKLNVHLKVPGLTMSGPGFHQARVIIDAVDIYKTGELLLPCTTTGPQPSIGTIASDKTDGDNKITAGEPATILDTVSYKNLKPGTYFLEGELFNKTTGQLTGIKSARIPVTVPGTGTALQSGTFAQKPEFNLTAAQTAEGTSYVVYETLTDATGKFVAEHRDPNDPAQTITVIKENKPVVTTLARTWDAFKNGGQNVLIPGKTTDLIDSITASNLIKDKDYIIQSWFETGNPSNPKVVTEKKFGSIFKGSLNNQGIYSYTGDISVHITDQAFIANPTTVYARADLYEVTPTGNKLLVEHNKDHNAPDQTITVDNKTVDLYILKENAGTVKPGANDFVTFKVKCASGTETFAYANADGGSAMLTQGGAQPFIATGLRVGDTCTITEEGLTSSTVTMAGDPTWELRHNPFADPNTLPAVSMNPAGGTSKSVTVKVDALNADTGMVALVAHNTYVDNVGKFYLKKKVVNPELPGVPTSFNFNYECKLPSGAIETNTDPITLTNGGTPYTSKEFPVGTICTVTELDPKVPGLGWSGSWMNNDGDVTNGLSITLPAIENGKNPYTAEIVPVVGGEMTNTYTSENSSFTILKKATLDGVETPVTGKEFTFEYSCVYNGKATTNTIKVPANGEAKSIVNIAKGSVCTVKEIDPASVVPNSTLSANLVVDGAVDADPTAGIAKFTIPTSGTATIVINANNTFTSKKGSFSVTKAVDAPGVNGASTKVFNFDVVCENPTLWGTNTMASTMSVTHGSVSSSQPMPVGTTCKVTEQETPIADATATGTTLEFVKGNGTINGRTASFTIIEGTQAIQVKAINKYKAHVGKLAVIKKTAGNGAPKVSGPWVFDVTCGTEKDVITVNAVNQAVSSTKEFPVGATCTIAERPQATPGVTPRLTWDETGSTADQPVTVTIPKQNGNQIVTKTVTATNTYTLKEGSFTIVKDLKVLADGVSINPVFDFTYSCVAPDGTKVEGPVQVDSRTLGQTITVPADSNCTVTETLVKPPAGTTVDRTVKAVDANGVLIPGSLGTNETKFTVPAGDKVSVKVLQSNVYKKDGASFQVTKDVTGDGATTVLGYEPSFNFGWECTLGDHVVAGKFGLTPSVGDTVATVGEAQDVRHGATCRVWETGSDKDANIPTNIVFDPQWTNNPAGSKVLGSYKAKDGTTHKNVIEFTVDKAKPVQASVTMTNDYKLKKGSIEVIKKTENVNGGTVALDKKVRLTINCGPGALTKSATLVSNDPNSKVRIDNVPLGTVCTVEESTTGIDVVGHSRVTSMSTDGGQTWVKGTSATVTIEKEGVTVQAQAKNVYERQHGSFDVTKVVTPPSNLTSVTLPTSYNFTWTCTPPAGSTEVALTGTITGVKDGETKAAGTQIPYGYTCVVTEDPATAQGAQLVATLSNNNFTIGADNKHVSVTASNVYTKDLGTFELLKESAAGTGVALPVSFNFVYTCTDVKGSIVADKVEIKGLKAGDPTSKYTSGPLPTGATCVVTEKADDPVVAGAGRDVSWTLSGPGVDPASATAGGDTFTFKIGPNTTHRVIKAKNDYTLKDTTLKILKNASAPADAGTLFTFDYECKSPVKDVSGKVVVPADGQAHDVVDAAGQPVKVPYGAVCTFTEAADNTAVGGHTHTVSLSVTGTATPVTPKVDLAQKDASISFVADSENVITVSANNVFTPNPEIGTTLTANGAHDITVKDSAPTVVMVDTVSYKNVPAGNYVLEGVLTDTKTGELTSVRSADLLTVVDGQPGSLGHEEAGLAQITFTVPAQVVKAHPALTAFEYLWKASDVTVNTATGEVTPNSGAKPVAEHAVKGDVEQTVTVTLKPEIGTKAKGVVDGKDTTEVPAGKPATIVDTIEYRNLVVGTEYQLRGELMYKDGTSTGIVVVKSFTADVVGTADAPGKVDMTFTVPADKVIAGKDFVVFEKLYTAGSLNEDGSLVAEDTKPIATHEDLKDKGQTVQTPGLETNASIGDTVQGPVFDPNKIIEIKDRVVWSNLVKGREYQITGTLRYQADATLANGTVVKKEDIVPSDNPIVTIKPATDEEAAKGEAIVTFKVKAGDIQGQAVVVFEDLLHEGVVVAAHHDITDEKQTVHSPKLGTTATDPTDGDKFLPAGKTADVLDVVAYEGLKAGEKYVLIGKLMDTSALNTDPVAIAYQRFTASATGAGTVNMTFKDAPVVAGKSYVVFETAYLEADTTKDTSSAIPDAVKVNDGAKPVAEHADPSDKAQTVYTPQITTDAKDAEDGDKYVDPTKDITIIDVVTYKGLDTSKTYTLKGELKIKDGTEEGTSTGIFSEIQIGKDTAHPITAADGKVELTFTIPVEKAKELGLIGKTIVVFETLLHEGKEVAIHHDINDTNQTVYTPSLGTTARDKADGDQVLEVGKDATIEDTVAWNSLEPGTYVLLGTLMDKATGKPVAGAKATPLTFEVKKGETQGTQKVTFTVPGDQIKAGSVFVVFEAAYKAGDVDNQGTPKPGTKPVATHEDINDIPQTLTAPEVKTNAYDAVDQDKNLDGTQDVVDVVDEITYTNLLPGKTYTITGELHYQNVAADGTITDGGVVPGVTAEPITLVVDGVNVPVTGTVTMTFKVPAKALVGQTLVAFESVYEDGKLVAAHTEITDEAQTVYVPELKTFAEGKEGTKILTAGADGTVTDTIAWKSLAPGDYVMVGRLMDKADATGQTQAEGVAPKAQTFTITKEMAKKGNGTIEMTFAVPAGTAVEGKTFVVFETAYKAGDVSGATSTGSTTFEIAAGAVPVAAHVDINSTEQAVTTSDLTTDAKDKADGDKNLAIEGTVTIVDTVSFTGLQIGKEYTITGDLNYQLDGTLADGKTVVKRGDKVKDEAGKVITATKTFKATVSTGSETLEFVVPASRIAGLPVVVFEDLSQGNIPVASHHDLNDEAQTVYTPSLKTSAENVKGGKALEIGADAQIIDTVTWKNLAPGTYSLTGTLMDKKTEKPVEGATATPTTFTVAKGEREGSAQVTFTVPGDKIVEGASFVVFEVLKGTVTKADGTTEEVTVATHEDINDADQTVTTAKISTEAKDGADGDKIVNGSEPVVIVDVVSYAGLDPEKTYTLTGTLRFPDPNNPDNKEGIAVDPTKYKVEPVTFKPEKSSGTVEMTFYVEAGVIVNTQVVVFEDLTGDNGFLLTHHDITDEKQTVTSPTIGTVATGDQAHNYVYADQASTIKDTVSYEKLEGGKEYVITGELHKKNADGTDGGVIAGVTAKPVTFTADASGKGTVEMTFTIPAGTLTGVEQVVVFEKAYLVSQVTVNGDVVTPKTSPDTNKPYGPVATHEDITDVKQTVNVGKKPEIGTVLAPEGVERVKNDGKTYETDPGVTTTFIDTVDYKGLIPGKSYVLKGQLYITETQTIGPTAYEVFVPQTADGTVKMTFKDVPAAQLAAGQKVVAYEYLFEGDQSPEPAGATPIAKHDNFGDINQTVYISEIPEIGTKLEGPAGAKHIENIEADLVLTDTVSYTGLRVGTEYTLQAQLMSVVPDPNDATKMVVDKDTGVVGTTSFTPTQKKGTTTVTYTVPANTLKDLLAGNGKLTLVAFETLWLTSDVNINGQNVTPKDATKKPVTDHKDPNDKGQTVTVAKPGIGTTLVGPNDKDPHKLSLTPEMMSVTLTDTVSYTQLLAGKSYTITGKLMGGTGVAGETGEETGITLVSKPFTPQAEGTKTLVSGTVEVTFEVPRAVLEKYSKLVAFEKLWLTADLNDDGTPKNDDEGEPKKPVAEHEDFTDSDQTVTIGKPEVKTSATVNGAQAIDLDKVTGDTFTVTDKVSYTNLSVGTQYALTGTLMDKLSQAPILDAAGKPITATKAFTPTSADGTTNLDFQVPVAAVKTGAAALVVYEKLWLAGDVDAAGQPKDTTVKPVATHEDINDPLQTIVTDKTLFGSFEVTKTLSAPEGVTIDAALLNAEFKFDYQCYAPSTTDPSGWGLTDKAGTLMVKPNQSVKVTGIPDGYRCEIWEDMTWVNTLSDQSAALTWSQTVVDGAGNPVTTNLFAGNDGKLSFMIGGDDHVINRVLGATNTVTDVPRIGTSAFTAGGTTVASGLTFNDMVDYHKLEGGKSYTLVTELRHMGSGDKLSPDMKPISVHTVTADKSGTGVWRVPITMPVIAGVDSLKLVVFEYLYPAGTVDAEGNVTPGTKVIASHEERNLNPDTSKQDVVFRSGFGSFDVTKKVVNETDKTIEGPFTFTYECEVPAGAPVGPGVTVKDGKVSGTFNLKANETSPKVEGLPLGASCTITEQWSAPELTKQTVTWSLEAAGAQGAWSNGYDNNKAHFTVAEFSHVSAEATNTFTPYKPILKTLAVDKADGDKVLEGTAQIITDTVSYADVPVGDYTLIGKLWNKTDGHIVKVDDKSDLDLMVTQNVKATAVIGHWLMDIPVPAYVQGKELVVFEYLYKAGSTDTKDLIAKHDDKDDAAQTVNSSTPGEPDLFTDAREGGDRVLSARNGGTVIDTVTYNNLPGETEFELRGTLVLKGANGTWTDTGIKATKRVVTGVADARLGVTSGTWTLEFAVPATLSRNWADRQLVVFERLFKLDDLDKPYLEHADINDVAQTILVDRPTTETSTTTPGTPGTVTTTVTTTTSTPPVASETTTPPTPPVLGVVTQPVPQVPSITIVPKRPPLARTGASDALLLAAAALAMIGVAGGIGIIAGKKRRKEEE